MPLSVFLVTLGAVLALELLAHEALQWPPNYLQAVIPPVVLVGWWTVSGRKGEWPPPRNRRR